MSSQRIRVTAMTHRGAVRPGNEDALVVGGFVASEVDLADPVVWRLDTEEPFVVAVADGLGGYAGGEIAAGHAARRLAVAGPGLTDHADVVEFLRRISTEIQARSGDPGLAGMGTTVAGLLLRPDGSVWFNVGDSRVLLLNGGYLGQLSEDDSPCSGDEPGTAVTSRITQYLGGPGSDGTIHPHVGSLVPSPETCWLLCSDGLSDLVAIEEIERILATEQDEARAVKAMWVAAMNAAGSDNITIALVAVAQG